MSATKKEIIQQLQKELLLLQGYKPPPAGKTGFGLGPVEAAFPNAVFPVGALHEFVSAAAEHTAATAGFIGGLLAPLMKDGGACIWIRATQMLFPPALKTFGIEPDRIVFVDPAREKDVLWAMEEALKCEGLAAVIGETRDIGFTASRRLQLAVEQSRVTGFILRDQPRNLNPVACMARWRITPLASDPGNGLPGVGFPRWRVELMKVRNGKPGIWQLEWAEGRFHTLAGIADDAAQQPLIRVRKTG